MGGAVRQGSFSSTGTGTSPAKATLADVTCTPLELYTANCAAVSKPVLFALSGPQSRYNTKVTRYWLPPRWS